MYSVSIIRKNKDMQIFMYQSASQLILIIAITNLLRNSDIELTTIYINYCRTTNIHYTNFIMKGGGSRVLRRAVANRMVSFYPNKRKIEQPLIPKETAYCTILEGPYGS